MTASVRAQGPLDASAAPLLADQLQQATEAARLVLVDLHETRDAGHAVVRVIIDASVRAREAGKRLLVIGAPPIDDADLSSSIASGVVAWLTTERPVPRSDGRIDNPVNVGVVASRVMAVPASELWLHGSDGVLRRAWSPLATPDSLAGRSVEVYLGPGGQLNGWHDPQSGLAINQRRLNARPAVDAALRCLGRCGIVWRTPAPAALIEHEERCLTCAGPLAPA